MDGWKEKIPELWINNSWIPQLNNVPKLSVSSVKDIFCEAQGHHVKKAHSTKNTKILFLVYKTFCLQNQYQKVNILKNHGTTHGKTKENGNWLSEGNIRSSTLILYTEVQTRNKYSTISVIWLFYSLISPVIQHQMYTNPECLSSRSNRLRVWEESSVWSKNVWHK